MLSSLACATSKERRLGNKYGAALVVSRASAKRLAQNLCGNTIDLGLAGDAALGDARPNGTRKTTRHALPYVFYSALRARRIGIYPAMAWLTTAYIAMSLVPDRQ